MNTYTQLSDDYARIEQVIYYLEQNASRQPSLDEIAEHIHLSEYHLQRLFTRWVGVSPKRFLQFITKENAKRLLQEASVLDAALGAGLSGPGRLHDLLIQTEAVTPGELKTRGAGVEIRAGFHATPFGECLLALTGRGICFLAFVQPAGRQAVLDELHGRWPNARIGLEPAATAPLAARIFADAPSGSPPLGLHLRGTNFQLKVWEALLRLPAGRVTTYSGLAAAIGQPGAARAVGSAVGNNPIAYVIPCHRVLLGSGDFGDYRCGRARKQAILAYEHLHEHERIPSGR
jgi:AraC family transcriptional regulator of adaptative response/methylated-DNA-[protein]-cysteine methyltransferase